MSVSILSLHRPPLSAKAWLTALALFSTIASCISMTVLYQDPFAHIKLCLSGSVPARQDGALVLLGHCAWCYLAAGFALAALMAPKPQ